MATVNRRFAAHQYVWAIGASRTLGSMTAKESGDEEPTMAWSNPDGLRIHISGEAKQITSFDFDDGPLRFDGSGNTIARMVLRQNTYNL
ncbi:hypothetical protein OLZ32_38680 [Rhizobium sp. 1AS11]|uniref:hypothetical protein n=1 Tax=Rhizobium acaciae TaxID=2989736 RepID=UPI002220AFA7|nr:hypothetical protein [Rhizobium acaciae]MCW1414104.1 hypothetical protein [Rhizobium acaciae]MCW1746264.1 hypothetical protein [Rhizobium acaciae]MCW1752004.1 hypothetical protein [Rhizobium acaciae]